MKDESTILLSIYNALSHWFHLFGAWVQAVAPEVLLTTRGICHLVIFLIIAGYRKKTDRHRQFVGLMAGMLAGANLAEAYRIAVNYTSFLALAQFPLTVSMLGFMFFTIYSRGNMAKLIPPRFDRLVR